MDRPAASAVRDNEAKHIGNEATCHLYKLSNVNDVTPARRRRAVIVRKMLSSVTPCIKLSLDVCMDSTFIPTSVFFKMEYRCCCHARHRIDRNTHLRPVLTTHSRTRPTLASEIHPGNSRRVHLHVADPLRRRYAIHSLEQIQICLTTIGRKGQ